MTSRCGTSSCTIRIESGLIYDARFGLHVYHPAERFRPTNNPLYGMRWQGRVYESLTLVVAERPFFRYSTEQCAARAAAN